MNKKELDSLLKMKDDELSVLSAVNTHVLENLVSQRDDALVRILEAENRTNAASKRLDDMAAEINERVQKHEDEKKKIKEDAAKDFDNASSSLVQQNAVLRQQIAELTSLVNTLGGTELGKKMRDEAEKVHLKAVIDASNKRLVELG